MTAEPPRFLFVPVSGPFGMGEYARSLSIAQAAATQWPDAEIRFLLSREAPYAARTPFPATLLAASPTFHSPAVIDVIDRWRPHVVVFDNAGRTAQLRAAHRAGAKVVYISARARQRRKAFRLRWMRVIDEHWIAYPEFIAGSLTMVERLKLRFAGRPVLRFLDVVMAGAGAARGLGAGLAVRDSSPASYVLVVPGGGTGHRGATNAISEFRAAAAGLAAITDTIFVGPEARPAAIAGLRECGALPQSELAALMRGARLIVTNGGSTLLQSIACGTPCVAVPIAGDQAGRIRRCARAGVAVPASLAAADILRIAGGLLQDPAARDGLAARARALGLADGLDVALRGLGRLLSARTG